MQIALAVLLSLAACKGQGKGKASNDTSSSGGTPSSGSTSSSGRTPSSGSAAKPSFNPCAIKGNELIYLVDTDQNFLSFDPEKLDGDPFHLVGKLECETAGQPFSMGVANDGIAWVLYNTGRVYRVSIVDARCVKAGDPDEGPETFGMGFASVGATAEKLFVAANDSSKMLAQLDTMATPIAWRPIAAITANQSRSPELTGTADGKLFGYFPEEGTGGFVQELDTKTGAPVGARMPLGIKVGEIEAYAFAHWGGVFYIFITAEHVSSAHSINRKTGKHAVVRERTPFEVVGAGVSTCAPELERAP